jgi:hypothetical protein
MKGAVIAGNPQNELCKKTMDIFVTVSCNFLCLLSICAVYRVLFLFFLDSRILCFSRESRLLSLSLQRLYVVLGSVVRMSNRC